jgi:hypothetical protein
MFINGDCRFCVWWKSDLLKDGVHPEFWNTLTGIVLCTCLSLLSSEETSRRPVNSSELTSESVPIFCAFALGLRPYVTHRRSGIGCRMNSCIGTRCELNNPKKDGQYRTSLLVSFVKLRSSQQDRHKVPYFLATSSTACVYFYFASVFSVFVSRCFPSFWFFLKLGVSASAMDLLVAAWHSI